MLQQELSRKPVPVVDIWTRTEAAGFMGTAPLAAAISQAILADRGVKVSEPMLQYGLSRFPTEPFIYPEAKPTIQQLMTSGNIVSTWTQGETHDQTVKVATSGLRTTREIRHYASEEKIGDLPRLVQELPEDREIVIVDDKSKNIVEAARQIAQLPEPLRNRIHLVWINQGRTKNEVPKGYTVEDFKKEFTTIESLQSLLPAQQDNMQSDPRVAALQDIAQKGTGYFLLDVDHTLLHTKAWKEAIEADINRRIDGETLIDPFVDERLGITAETHRRRHIFANGMSGRMIVSVEAIADPSQRFVIKVGRTPFEAAKIKREREGYFVMQQSPLAPHLVQCDMAHASCGVIVSTEFPGANIRELLQQGKVTLTDVKPTLQHIQSLVAGWWAGQEKKPPNGDLVSMQRTEWQETVRETQSMLTEYATAVGISAADLFTLPIQIDENRPAISLQQAMQAMEVFLAQPPAYTIVDHNDLTPANILLSDSHEFRVGDFEWVGPADPAESMVRMIKQLSSTTAQNRGATAMRVTQTGVVAIDGYHDRDHWSDECVELEDEGREYARQMQEQLGDPDFARRVEYYFMGSYIRELALAKRRGLTQEIPLIVGKIIQHYATIQSM